MKDLFENVHMDNVLSFLKETGLYQKIYTWLQSWKHNKLINWKQIIAETKYHYVCDSRNSSGK